jgi:uncharacterized protein YkwD
LLARIAGERGRLGQAPLQIDRALVQAARGLAQRVRSKRFSGPVAPAGEAPSARALRAGVRLAPYTEDFLGARSPDDAWESILDSPLARKHLLEPGATRIGLGVAELPGREGEVPLRLLVAAATRDPTSPS